MDFELTNRQKQIRMAAREFAEANWRELDKNVMSRRIFRENSLRKLPSWGLSVPLLKKSMEGLA